MRVLTCICALLAVLVSLTAFCVATQLITIRGLQPPSTTALAKRLDIQSQFNKKLVDYANGLNVRLRALEPNAPSEPNTP